MTALTKLDRNLLLEKILTEMFEHRFKDIAQSATLELRKRIEDEHPKFIKMYADPESRRYLATTLVNTFNAASSANNTVRMFKPIYGTVYSETREPYSSEIKYLRESNIFSPITLQTFAVSQGLSRIYCSAWNDYHQASRKINVVLAAYNTRRKLAADFPEWAALLGPTVTKMQLPQIDPKEVIANLQIHGYKA